ncbi:MAG: hypothetical protein ACYSTI_10055 [Planctomycetota bacterium]|jgi:hypothetical protein
MTYVNQKGYPDPDAPDVPPGEYLCEIRKIEAGHTVNNDDGAERWWVKGVILDEGPQKGRHWDDNWIFNSSNESLQRRQVLILHRVGGFDKEYEGGFERENFIGKQVYVTFCEDTYQGRTRHKVEFNGYRSIESPSEEERPDVEEENIPF